VSRVVVLGDALLDRDIDGEVTRVCPDAPAPVVDVVDEHVRPGGAALAAALAAAHGSRVTLLTALGADGGSDLLSDLLRRGGVEIVAARLRGPMPQKVRVRAGSRSIARLDLGGPPAPVERLPDVLPDVLHDAAAVLVADYGRGMAALPAVRVALATTARHVPTVWDPHVRGPIAVPGVQLVSPNEAELAALTGTQRRSLDLRSASGQAQQLAESWSAHAVVVTRGARGALLHSRGAPPLVVPAPPVPDSDACGAGDCFAATLAHELAGGALPSRAVEAAVHAAAEFVGRGGAAAWVGPDPVAHAGSRADARAVVARVRARGGVVVATGGCFDLLHAGHVATLQAARRLGDCLVVLCNSDDSVRRLKGPDRPLQPVADRVATLRALDCVDAVEVFDEQTPVAALGRLRPDIFAKGGDYVLGELPEARTMARWGGQVVVLPYLAGRSTTRLLEEAARRGR
jgi:rfaE bifunctional protein nucleotidyltransferase chain/domain/rfaE bifunctional protein kinase chain/domain